MPALTIWSPEDAVLGLVAPLAAAVAAPGPALVVDLDPNGPDYPSERSLADLVADGPTKAELAPSRRGVAILKNGGVAGGEARAVVEALVKGWPSVVLRTPSGNPFGGIPVVPVLPLVPGDLLRRATRRPAVYQRGGWPVMPPGPGVVLPKPDPRTLEALLSGRLPTTDRWLRRWSMVWRTPWV